MRHIKTYKVFESNKIDIEDIKDILMELEDQGFETKVQKDNLKDHKNGKPDYYDGVRNDISVIIERPYSNPPFLDRSYFNTKGVEEYVDRILEYIKQIGGVKANIIVLPRQKSIVFNPVWRNLKAKTLVIIIEVN